MTIKKYIFFFSFWISSVSLITAQCYSDRHNTTWYDAWTSCTAAPNPNPDLAQSHWILYNLGRPYRLKTSHFWNANDPDALQNGLQDIRIDHSINGTEWNYFGDFTLAQASGRTIYEGVPGPDFDELEAQYILITALSNYGGPCYSLSEIKIDVDEIIISSVEDNSIADAYCFTVQIMPNPFVDQTLLQIKTNCNQAIYYSLVDALGREIIKPTLYQPADSSISLSGKSLSPGIYYLLVTDGQQRKSYKIAKMK